MPWHEESTLTPAGSGLSVQALVSSVTGQESREPLGVPPELPHLPQCDPLLDHAGSPSASNLASPQPDLADGSQTSLEASLAQISAAISNGAAACWDHRLEACWWQEARSLGPPAQACAEGSLPEVGAVWHPCCPALPLSGSQGPGRALGFESCTPGLGRAPPLSGCVASGKSHTLSGP